MTDKKSVPYHCPLCPAEEKCGFHGILWFPGSDKPKCDHHTNETNAPDLVPMVPSRGKD
jgi:hypothetical protein